MVIIVRWRRTVYCWTNYDFICCVTVMRQYIVLAKGNVRITVEMQLRFLTVSS